MTISLERAEAVRTTEEAAASGRVGLSQIVLVGLAMAYPFHYYVDVAGLGGIVDVSLGDVLIGFVVIGFCASVLLGRWVVPRYAIPVLLFALVAFLSLIPPWLRFSASPAYFDPIPGLGEIVKLFGSATWMIAMYVLLRSDPIEGIRRFAGVSVLMAMAFALVTIHQSLGHPGTRPAGPFENENLYANYLNMNLFLLMFLSRRPAGSRRRRFTPAAWIGIPVLAAGVVATGSRGAVIGLVAALPFAIRWRAAWRSMSARRGCNLALTAGACAASVLAFWHANPFIANRLSSILSGQGPNIASRAYLWRIGLHAFATAPVLGIGYHQFPQYAQVVYGWKSQVAHDMYVEVAAELGCLGLVAFGWLLFVIFRDALRFARDPRFPVVPLITAIIVATLVQGLVANEEHDRSMWIAFGMLAAIGEHVDAYVKTRRALWR